MNERDNRADFLHEKTEAAYNEVMNALVHLVNAITEERDYYEQKTEQLLKERSDNEPAK